MEVVLSRVWWNSNSSWLLQRQGWSSLRKVLAVVGDLDSSTACHSAAEICQVSTRYWPFFEDVKMPSRDDAGWMSNTYQ